jgi:hypothetical protein
MFLRLMVFSSRAVLLFMLLVAPVTTAQTITPEPATPAPGILRPFMSTMFEADFESAPEVTADEGWQMVQQREDSAYCISNYQSQYGRYPVFLFGNPDWTDYVLEAQIQLTSRDFGHAAMLTRLDDARWGYRHRLFFDAWGMGFAQYYYGGQDGRLSQVLGEYRMPVESGHWYVFRAEVEGKIVRTIVNGIAMGFYNSDKNMAGGAGIEAGPGVRLCVDDLVVRSLDRSEAALKDVTQGVATRNANVRLLPGLAYPRVSALSKDEMLYIIGWNADHTWVNIRKN